MQTITIPPMFCESPLHGREKINESTDVRIAMDCAVMKSPRVSGRLGLSPLSSLGGLVSLASLFVVVSCADFITSRDNDIRESTQALEKARDDGQRARAYSSRGVAYSEKARYSRITKRIPNDEYERFFDLAIKDHNQAVALDPNNAEVYFNRGQAYYDRGSGDFVYSTEIWKVNPSTKAWLDAAASDFEKAAEKNPKNDLAFDRLGLAYQEAGQEDDAVRAYTQEMKLNERLGKLRLADAYCFFGFRHQQQKEYAVAAAAYQKSTEFGIADDKSCPYDPFGNSVAIFTTETHEYDKAWEMVHRALKMGRVIAPELLVRLQKESGRSH
jgi:tetratricopeptide (TPR) repeat protein